MKAARAAAERHTQALSTVDAMMERLSQQALDHEAAMAAHEHPVVVSSTNESTAAKGADHRLAGEVGGGDGQASHHGGSVRSWSRASTISGHSAAHAEEDVLGVGHSTARSATAAPAGGQTLHDYQTSSTAQSFAESDSEVRLISGRSNVVGKAEVRRQSANSLSEAMTTMDTLVRSLSFEQPAEDATINSPQPYGLAVGTESPASARASEVFDGLPMRSPVLTTPQQRQHNVAHAFDAAGSPSPNTARLRQAALLDLLQQAKATLATSPFANRSPRDTTIRSAAGATAHRD